MDSPGQFSHHTRGLSESRNPQDLELFHFPVFNFVCSEIWEKSCALEASGAFPITPFPRMSQVTLSHWDGIFPFLSLQPWFGSPAHCRLSRDIFPLFLSQDTQSNHPESVYQKDDDA